MTTTIRASVRPAKYLGAPRTGLWTASAMIRDANNRVIRAASTDRQSWPEAMQAAYKLLADLHTELMAEVHASRASRRDEPCEICAGPVGGYGPRYCTCGASLIRHSAAHPHARPTRHDDPFDTCYAYHEAEPALAHVITQEATA